MIIIENEFLRAAIDPKGAQLSSLINKETGTEHMWQAGEAWPWHSPNLFPVIGSLINNQIIVEGKPYEITQRHGFARNAEFLLLDASPTHAKFSLPYSEHTLAMYPFKFDLHITYDLIDNALRVTLKVINLDPGTIYFMIGGHPAFNVPFHPGENYEDYYLQFETEEPLTEHLLSADGFFSGETRPVRLEGRNLQLSHQLFADDALIFKNLKSRRVTIKSHKHDQTLTVQFPHFKYLGIWARTDSDFVCIEPWLGHADVAGEPVEFSQREGVEKLGHGHVFEACYYISL